MGAGRQDRRDGVPMVRRGDDDGVDVAPRQQLAEIDEGRAAGIGAGLALSGISAMDALDGILAALPMDIADSDDLNVTIAEETTEMSAAHHADADEAEVDTVVRPLALALLGANVRIEDERGSAGRSRAGQELATS